MPVSVTCHNSCSGEVRSFKNTIQEWLNIPGNNTFNGQDFNQGIIM